MSKKILITSALPYVNNVPHLGNLIGCALSADVFARFCRSFGYNTLFVCGLDEHGTTTETTAKKEGLTPKELCDKYAKLHKEVYDWFQCDFDVFGRTSQEIHHQTTQEIFQEVYKHGFVIEKEIEQLFSKKSQMFLADRFVEGTCPYCRYEQAKGDQCESCGKLLNATELINPKAVMDGEAPILKKTNHLFLDLPKLQKQLEDWVDHQAKEGQWSQNAIRQTRAWFKEGLTERAITRDLKWGVHVPLKGFEEKVFYVWFDAPIAYISMTRNIREDWKEWWHNPKKVKLVQFMGKDNIPFHTILFPGTIFAAKMNHTMLTDINVTEYLNYESGKFSKSRNTGVFGDDAMNSGIPADVWRYYLLMNRPETSDTLFTWNDFGEKTNNELVANLGNFVNRTLVFLKKFFDNKIPEPNPEASDLACLEQQAGLIEEITEHLHKQQLKDALKKIMAFSKRGNLYFQDNAPWKAIKEAPDRAATALYILTNMVKDLAILIEPYLPTTAKAIWTQLNLEKKPWSDLAKQSIPEGHILASPKTLFQKIEAKTLTEFKERFAGKQEAPKLIPLALRVGKITGVEKHPDAEKLFIEQIDFGDEQKQIVSGLVDHCTIEDLVGKKIIVAYNLKSAKLRGVKSEGMLLVAQDKTQLEVLSPNAELGEFLLGSKDTKEISIDNFFKHCFEVKNQEVFVDKKALQRIKTKIIINGKVS